MLEKKMTLKNSKNVKVIKQSPLKLQGEGVSI